MRGVRSAWTAACRRARVAENMMMAVGRLVVDRVIREMKLSGESSLLAKTSDSGMDVKEQLGLLRRRVRVEDGCGRGRDYVFEEFL